MMDVVNNNGDKILYYKNNISLSNKIKELDFFFKNVTNEK